VVEQAPLKQGRYSLWVTIEHFAEQGRARKFQQLLSADSVV
jgi:hypothetical protein